MSADATELLTTSFEWSTTIMGAPRTKKNSAQIARTKDGRMFIVQSAPLKKWQADAAIQLQSAWRGRAPLAGPINLSAVVYAEKDIGDLLNYLAAVSDAIEKAGVIVNDRQVRTVDGSRLMVDRARPRVEVTITSID